MPVSKVDRVHPGLPTREEVQENPSMFYSDHVPQLMMVPLGADIQPLKIMSYNVYGEPAPCGYILPPDYDHDARKGRICAGINLCANNNDVDVILLQEVSEDQRDKLAAQLGEQWDVSVVSKHHLVTCYRKDKFECQLLAQTEGRGPNEMTRTYDYLQISSLKRIGTDLTLIRLVNMHGDPDPDKQNKESVFNTLLAQDAAMGLRVVAGDINIAMAAMHGQKGVTSMVPPGFNYVNIKDEEQPTAANRKHEIANSTDGGLFKLPDGHASKCWLQALDIQTGALIDDASLNRDRPIDYTPIVQAVYQSADDKLRASMLDTLQKLVDRVQKSPWYLRADKEGQAGKRRVLNELITDILGAPPGSNYKNIIETWEKIQTSQGDNASQMISYRDIIHEHRNIFFSSNRSSSTANTKTEDAIDALKHESRNPP